MPGRRMHNNLYALIYFRRYNPVLKTSSPVASEIEQYKSRVQQIQNEADGLVRDLKDKDNMIGVRFYQIYYLCLRIMSLVALMAPLISLVL